MQEVPSDLMKSLQEKIEKFSLHLEKMKLAEYIELMNNPVRLLFINFMAGVARGLGIAVGFTILGALVLVILQRLVILHLPLISDFIAAIVRLVQIQLHGGI